jgi:hypothetical protein
MREKLMPEMQSLLPRRFSSRAMRGWGAAGVVVSAFLLGTLPAGDNAFNRAKSNVTQLVRQSAWNHALATEPAASPWPWEEIVMPAEGTSVPRLGLSAAVLRATHDDTEPSHPVKLPKTSAMAQDPHLMPDLRAPHVAVTSDMEDDRTDHLNFGCEPADRTSLKAKSPPAADAAQAEPVVEPRPSTEKQL